MKRFKWWIPLLAAVVLAILFVPGKPQLYDDGGTVTRFALTYKIVDWKQASNVPLTGRRVYIFPDNFKTLRELERLERKNQKFDDFSIGFSATIVELKQTTALLEPLDKEGLISCDRVVINLLNLEDIGAQAGDRVVVYYTGEILETYPVQIHATSWKLATDITE